VEKSVKKVEKIRFHSMTQEIELAPGIFLTKRATDNKNTQPLHSETAEKLFLQSMGLPDRLEYLTHELKRIVNSTIHLVNSNMEMEAYPIDKDLLLAIAENKDVIEKQQARINHLQQDIKEIETKLGYNQLKDESVVGNDAVIVDGDVEQLPDIGVYL
jgi:dGTP triphosphohydrolase